jgi:hypothetical protein
MKAGNYTIRKGQSVIISSADQKKLLGIGKYVGYKKVRIFGTVCNIPKFRMGKRIIYGYECWWIPESVSKKILKKQKGETKKGK